MQGQEPSPSWHVWSLLREGFVFSLSTKVKQFCSFQGFLKNKQTKFLKVLNLNRLNLLDRYLYQKTVRDLSSSLIESSHDFLFLRPREKFRCFFWFFFFFKSWFALYFYFFICCQWFSTTLHFFSCKIFSGQYCCLQSWEK